jgi:uncharacterized membrane protein YhhN
VSAGELLSQILEWHGVHVILKLLLMPVLLIYYVVESKPGVSWFVISALIMSLLGDAFLLLPGELYFMMGLGSFLAAHVVYIVAYRHHRSENRGDLQGIQKIRYSFPIVLCGSGLLAILYPHLGNLLMPVTLYALVLIIMVLNALFRLGRTSTVSFLMVFIGACLFMTSDSLLAINKFVSPIAKSGLWIMSTYILAQYLIVEGLIRHHHRS